MAYTVNDLIAQVQRRIKDTAYNPTEIIDYLDKAQKTVFNTIDLPPTEALVTYTLTANNSDITSSNGLPSGFVNVINLTDTTNGSDKQLIYKNYRELDFEYPGNMDAADYPAGSPLYYYVFGGVVRVFPTPDKAYTVALRYNKTATTLTTGSDVPSVPEQYQELLVLGAAYRVLQVKDNYDQAGVLQNAFDEQLLQLTIRYGQRQTGTPTRMRINRRAIGKTNF